MCSIDMACRLICQRGMGVWLLDQMTSRITPGSRDWTGIRWPGERRRRPSGVFCNVSCLTSSHSCA